MVWTVAAVALPQYRRSAYRPVQQLARGLVTAIAAGLIISALTGGYYQISGPTGAMAAILGSLIATYGMQGMFVATFLPVRCLILRLCCTSATLTSYPRRLSPVLPRVLRSSSRWVRIDNSSARTRKGPVIAKIISHKDLGFHPDIATTLIALFVVLLMVFFSRKMERGRIGLAHRHYHRN